MSNERMSIAYKGKEGETTESRMWGMVGANLGLVRLACGRMAGRGVDRDELYSAGVDGLIRAVKKFDDKRGVKFSTYAMYWIEEAMQQAIKGENKVHGTKPADSLQRQAIERDEQAKKNPAHPAHQRYSVVAIENTPGDDEEDQFGGQSDDYVVGMSYSVLDGLPERERQALWLRCGIGDDCERTLSEVGRVLGVTKERVRVLQELALGKLTSNGASD